MKPGIFPHTMFKSLENGFDLRVEGDYGLIPVSKEEANSLVEETENFISAVRKYLVKEGYELTKELGL